MTPVPSSPPPSAAEPAGVPPHPIFPRCHATFDGEHLNLEFEVYDHIYGVVADEELRKIMADIVTALEAAGVRVTAELVPEEPEGL